jgi:hypothetical protein
MIPLERQLAAPLKALGFKKKSRTWWRHGDETIQVLNLQKSEFGERLYVNLGVYVRALGEEESPPERRCQVQVRLERIASPGRWDPVACATAGDEPSPELVAAVLEDGIGWLDQVATLAGIGRHLESGGSDKGLVFATVWPLVGLQR